ncbi:MAG TPA: PEGA domain-containing protein [Rectinemataceae bacterium]|nr:PEGA domain-containing protein [Rectinemataceae bacterium]
MKRLLALFALVLVLGSAAFAQNKAALQIVCNQSGAQVFINGRLMGTTSPNIALLLPVGQYAVKVSKSGFLAYDTSVNLGAGGAVINVNLVQPGAPQAQVPQAQRMNVLPPPTVFNYSITVQCNVQGAQVIINGNPAGTTPFSSQVPGGSYSVLVRAPGYLDFNQNVVVNGAMTVLANLVPISFSLSVNANVAGADVIINGNPAGKTPFSAQVPGGSYTVTVRAAGYIDYNQNVVVSGAAQVNASLQPLSYQLNVVATNVNGAQVFLNGNPMGQTPFVSMLPPGSYGLIVRAPGFLDYSAQVLLSAAQTVSATLVPAMATWQLNFPDAFINRELKGAHLTLVLIFIDGVLQKGSGGQIPAGKHVVRLVTGGMATETQVELQAGRTYTFEPSLGLSVR